MQLHPLSHISSTSCPRATINMDWPIVLVYLYEITGGSLSSKKSGRGVVSLKMKLPDSLPRRCNLQDVLHVPALSYNLLSVAKAAEKGKVTEFNDNGCQITTSGGRLVAKATTVGSLYYLDCELVCQCCMTRNKGSLVASPLWTSQHAKSPDVIPNQPSGGTELRQHERLSSSVRLVSRASSQGLCSLALEEMEQLNHWTWSTATSAGR